MDEFKTWFFIGFEHIMDIQALDHTLFILALVVAYDSSQLKKIIFLVTAFTIGPVYYTHMTLPTNRCV